MGISDVIPGVSGGTMALVLGIYEQLVDSIRSINVGWFRRLFRLAAESVTDPRAELWSQFRKTNLHFLIPLGCGIVSAILIGSQFIPQLLSNYPFIVRGFFFGLILSSLWIPLRGVSFESNYTMVISAALILIGTIVGFVITDPGRQFLPDYRWTSEVSDGETLQSILRRTGSSLPAEKLFWKSRNRPLRTTVKQQFPDKFRNLNRNRNQQQATISSRKHEIEARSEPYRTLTIPAGVTVHVPKVRLDFTFFAGMIAICAMILPGISGSYILLILGTYFFILNVIKGSLSQLLSGTVPSSHLLYLSVFSGGAILGLIVFSRILGYFLSRLHSPTMAVLTGLMAGCLRGVWPFRAHLEGVYVNVFPDLLTTRSIAVYVSFFTGVVAMAGLFYISSVRPETEKVSIS